MLCCSISQLFFTVCVCDILSFSLSVQLIVVSFSFFFSFFFPNFCWILLFFRFIGFSYYIKTSIPLKVNATAFDLECRVATMCLANRAYKLTMRLANRAYKLTMCSMNKTCELTAG